MHNSNKTVSTRRFVKTLRSCSAVLAIATLLLLGAQPALGATITVDSTADNTTVDSACTLREAIQAANSNTAVDTCTAGDAGADEIQFSTGGTISLGSQLPIVSEQIDINGYSEPGASENTLADATDAVLTVILDAGGLNNALRIDAANSRVRGLVIQNFEAAGIRVLANGDGTVIDGNFIGTTADGTADSGATAGENNGVLIQPGANGCTVGGTTDEARNLLSGNGVRGIFIQSDNNIVQGNLVGTNAAGTGAVPNSVDVALNGPAILLAPGDGNQIGGSTAAERNVISGNAGDGIQIYQDASNNAIEGNYIGVDISGNAALPNARSGIVLFSTGATSSDGNTIIGNVIAAMPEKGVAVDGGIFTNTTIQDNLIGVGADGTTALGIGHGSAAAGDDDGSDPEPAIFIGGEATAIVSGNQILNSAIGIEVEDANSTLLATSSNNCVVFNDEGFINRNTVIQPFENNWWGQPDGPSGVGPGSGDSVTANVDFDPFLTSAPAGCSSYEADLAISKADSVDPVTAGTQFSYTVTVDNNGPQDALNVQVTDTLPADTTFVSTNGCTGDPGGFPTCSLGDIAASGSASYTITVDVVPSASGTLTNMASVTTDTVDPNASNDSISETTDVVAEADLGITKIDSADPVVAGSTLSYTIEVTNAGPSDASGVEVSDTLPADVTLVSTTGCAEDPNGVPTCTLGAMPSGGTASYDIEVEVDLGFEGTLANAASVSSSTADPNGGNDDASESTEVTAASSDLELTITDNADTPLEAGEQFDVILNLTNNGPQENTNVVVSGMLQGLQFVSSSCATSSGDDFTWNVGTLSASQSVNCTLRVETTVVQSASVTASASGDNGDPLPGNNTDIRAVFGISLVIPTLDRWGLLVFTLMLLATAGRVWRIRC